MMEDSVTIPMEAMRGRLSEVLPAWDQLPESVWKRAGALNTWGTNAIEGNTLNHDDVERILLLEESVADHPIHEIVETLQHESAFWNLPRRVDRPIDLVTALELHEEVFRGEVRKMPGRWRHSNVRIAGSRHRPPRRERIVPEMEAWVAGLRKRAGAPLLDSAAWMHHRFEQVHPFEDGNGRVGRLLLNLWLMQRGWPPLHILPPDRRAYLGALEAGNLGDLEPLRRFLGHCLARSLLDLLDQVGGPDDELHDLRHWAAQDWCPHGADYLALRCRQGALAGLRVNESSDRWRDARPGRPHWLTSEFAVRWYLERVGERMGEG